MTITTGMSQSFANVFGFDFVTHTENDTMWMGTQANGDNWYVKMNTYEIVVSITDCAGNSVWFEMGNEDNSRSGLVASLLCKNIVRYLQQCVAQKRKLRTKPTMAVNGLMVKKIWITKGF